MKCKTCGATPETADFYAGVKTYCKDHWRERVKENRNSKIEHYREYDRRRGFRGGASHSKQYKAQHPDRRTAQVAIGNAVRDGRITPWPACAHPNGCDSTKVEAHHPDYSRPLDVVWLCPSHHKQAHALFTSLIERRASASPTCTPQPTERRL